MKRFSCIIFSATAILSLRLANAQTLNDTIVTPERAVPSAGQVLSGTWLSSLQRPGPNGLQPAIPAIVTFSAEGNWISSPADATQTATQGLWIRVGDRKFLGTGFFFAFDANRVLLTVTKLRINYELSPDGKTLTGNTEAVIMDPTGKVLNTAGGAVFSMLRLPSEIPTNFYDFQKLP